MKITKVTYYNVTIGTEDYRRDGDGNWSVYSQTGFGVDYLPLTESLSREFEELFVEYTNREFWAW